MAVNTETAGTPPKPISSSMLKHQRTRFVADGSTVNTKLVGLSGKVVDYHSTIFKSVKFELVSVVSKAGVRDISPSIKPLLSFAWTLNNSQKAR